MNTYRVVMTTKRHTIKVKVVAPDKRTAGQQALAHGRMTLTDPTWSPIPQITML